MIEKMKTPLLQVENLHTVFPLYQGLFFPKKVGQLKALQEVSFELNPGEVLGVVGESGCGKSTLARSILQLIPSVNGKVLFEGQDLCKMSPENLRSLRPQIQMVFQDPYASLDPRQTIFEALAEPLHVHRKLSLEEQHTQVNQLLREVGISIREKNKYPHQFSGGQRQRIAIAKALALRPKLIIADEPVSSLDVSIRAQILSLLQELVQSRGLSLIFITHDLSILPTLAHRVAVLYLGKMVECGSIQSVFENPAHPYTQALLAAQPKLLQQFKPRKHSETVHGEPPSALNPPSGCAFHPRCPFATAQCQASAPPLETQGPFSQKVACFHATRIAQRSA